MNMHEFDVKVTKTETEESTGQSKWNTTVDDSSATKIDDIKLKET